MDELLKVEGLTKFFFLDKQSHIAAVNDVSFSIGRGETLGLVGESGSGKTTVGRCVLRLIQPTRGVVTFDGVDITGLSDNALRPLRHRMQLVFQEPFASLNPRFSVSQTLLEPLTLEHTLTKDEREDRVIEMLKATNLDERHLGRYPTQLTASEQQRVGIARALVTHPDLIVLDEPTSNLDPSTRAEILYLLMALQEQFGTSYLLISHDLTAVEAVSDRIAIMYLGRIVETAAAEEITARQCHPYSKALLSAVLYPDPRRPRESFVLEGEIPTAINPPDECSLIGRCPLAQAGCAKGVPPLEELEPGRFSACFRAREFSGI